MFRVKPISYNDALAKGIMDKKDKIVTVGQEEGEPKEHYSRIGWNSESLDKRLNYIKSDEELNFFIDTVSVKGLPQIIDNVFIKNSLGKYLSIKDNKLIESDTIDNNFSFEIKFSKTLTTTKSSTDFSDLPQGIQDLLNADPKENSVNLEISYKIDDTELKMYKDKDGDIKFDTVSNIKDQVLSQILNFDDLNKIGGICSIVKIIVLF